jgi:hypothetical protein
VLPVCHQAASAALKQADRSWATKTLCEPLSLRRVRRARAQSPPNSFRATVSSSEIVRSFLVAKASSKCVSSPRSSESALTKISSEPRQYQAYPHRYASPKCLHDGGGSGRFSKDCCGLLNDWNRAGFPCVLPKVARHQQLRNMMFSGFESRRPRQPNGWQIVTYRVAASSSPAFLH